MSRAPPAATASEAYVLSYFRTEAEALHLAVSDDGYDFTALNGGDAVLESDVGAESIRDPFLYDDGERFHLLGTDGWHSDHVVHATSPDLVAWSAPERLPVMADVEGTLNTWAPECYYDREAGVTRLLWSSTVGAGEAPDDPAEQAAYDHRIWAAETTDFESFTDPEVFLDPGFNVIDATVARHDGEYLLAVKDERGANTVDTDHKDVAIGRAETGRGPFTPLSDPVTPAPVEGPTLYRADGEWLLLYDHFIEGDYGASRSPDGEAWERADDAVSVPEGVRHGSVMGVERGVVESLRDAL
ncbi:MAG: glycoside hydrolase family 43 protein [Halobacteriaceae archaeon]